MAARLALAGNDVVAFARGAHAEAIAANGLLLRDLTGERRARVGLARTPAEAGPVDAVIVTTKGHQHRDVGPTLAPLLTGEQPVVFAVNGIPWWYGQNVGLPGIDPANDPAQRALDPTGDLVRIVGNRVVGGVLNSPNAIEAPGVVVNRTEQNVLQLGAVYPEFAPRIAPLAEALRAAGIDPGKGAPIRTEVWRKLMYTMCMGPLAALTGLTNGGIRGDPGLVAILEQMAGEGLALARAHGCDFPDGITFPSLGANASHMQSMGQDVMRGRPVEFMPIVGLPRAYAHAAGIACPALDMLTALLAGKLRGMGLA
jgi:2-dehydropantoate 2-reductase